MSLYNSDYQSYLQQLQKNCFYKPLLVMAYFLLYRFVSEIRDSLSKSNIGVH